MFMKKAMLLTSQAVYDSMEAYKENFVNEVKSFLNNEPNATQEEIEAFKVKASESFKYLVNNGATNRVAQQYPAIKNTIDDAIELVHKIYHPDDDLELTAGEMYVALFGAIKKADAPTTRAGLLDSIQNDIIERAFE